MKRLYIYLNNETLKMTFLVTRNDWNKSGNWKHNILCLQ